MRALVVALAVLLCSWATATAMAAEPIRGLAPQQLVATVPPAGFGRATGVWTDRAGDILATEDDRFFTFTADGRALVAWDVSDLAFSEPNPSVAMAPDGTIYAGAEDGTVHVYDVDGRLLRSWSGWHEPWTLLIDPSGDVLESTFDVNPARDFERFSPTGQDLGRAPGLGYGALGAMAPTGRAWEVDSNTVDGFLPSGRQFQQIGTYCTPGGGSPLEQCPDGSGTFGIGPPYAMAAGTDGGLATSAIGRIQVFDRDGRHLFNCARSAEALGYEPDGSGLVWTSDRDIYRAAFTTRPARGCAKARFGVSGVDSRAVTRLRREIRFHVSRPAKVSVSLYRMHAGRVLALEWDDIGTKARKGENRRVVRLPRHGRWWVQVKAVDRRLDEADAPFVRIKG